MKKNLHQRLQAKKRKILRRLKRSTNNPKTQPGDVNIKYDLTAKGQGISVAGIGIALKMVEKLKLQKRLNEGLKILKIHQPYKDADHVLNIAMNAFVGGQTLDDIELRRNDGNWLGIPIS